MKEIHVVAGVIHSADREHILIARRPEHLHQGGLWEFPGGKVQAGEQRRKALERELAEELAIEVVAAEPFLEVCHQYPEVAVLLDTWQVSAFSGTAVGNEGQEVRWVAIDELGRFAFPAANQPILDALAQQARAARGE